MGIIDATQDTTDHTARDWAIGALGEYSWRVVRINGWT